MQTLRKALGYWLYLVAPLVPLKALMKTAAGEGPATTSSNSSGSRSQQQQHLAPASQGSAPAMAVSAAVFPATSQGGKNISSISSKDTSHLKQEDLGSSRSSTSMHIRELRAADAGIAATGCLAGFASGLLGIGGGTIVTPLLAVFTGMHSALGLCILGCESQRSINLEKPLSLQDGRGI